MKRRRERPILVGGVVLALVVLAATGGLVLYAFAGVAASDLERHRLVAERLFDEIEGELSAIVAREEGRWFQEYRYFYVPQDNAYGNPGLVQSELSKEPTEPWIVGWFQVDPGNVVTSPQVPRANEVPLAVRNGTWVSGASSPLDELREILGQAGWSARPEPPPFKVVAVKERTKPNPAPQPAPEPDLLLNRNVQKRASRVAQVFSTKELNVNSFATEAPVDELVKQEEETQQQRLQQQEQTRQQWVQQQQQNQEKLAVEDTSQQVQIAEPPAGPAGPAGPTLDPDVSVVVTPLVGTRAGDHLVLYRTVRIGDDEHRQGIVLRRAELARHLEELVLADSGLRRYVSLAWDGAEPAPAVYAFSHRFADPFGSMGVTASLARVPELVGRDALTVPALAGAVLLAVFGGGVALYRAVRSELEYARRRNDFVAAVSHELKTPLTTIRMYAEMLRDGMVPADRQRTYHHTITMESDRLGRLIANVLELARLERGGPSPEVIAGSIGPVLLDAVEIVRPHAAAAGFTVAVEADPNLPPVRIDPDALTQIVVNLVDNAVKFAGAGERRIELTARGDGDGGVVVSVRDHGPGVPRSHLRRVFEPFWRGERELTRKTRGTGIGLALVRGLAQRMGASVAARNHPEGGFEVVLTLAS